MPEYDPNLTIRQARDEYFKSSGFSSDGGYRDKWVKLKAGRFTLAFPNTTSRVRAVKLHDLHHVLTGYATTWTGEAEIGAWEIASGCGRHYPAWFLNFGALAIGLLIAPRRVFEAFLRGRHSENLYAGELEDPLLDCTVRELRAQLMIPDGPHPWSNPGSVRDRLAFALWSSVSVIVSALPGLTAIALAAILLWSKGCR
jgi:hypothetical protein